MKKILVLLLFFFCAKLANAQTDTSLLYIKFPDIPPFSIIKYPDSTKFTKADLEKKKPTLIIGFSPDCEHCQHEMKQIIAHMELFKNYQIVMATPLDYKYLGKFYDDYHLSDYPNITIGKDPSWFIGTFYSIRSFPSIFLYNKKGEFVKAFDGSVPVEKIADAL